MDLRSYYGKIREAEATLADEFAVVVSLATPEGGRAGVLTEAPRKVAAKLIAEGRARVATEPEAEEFRTAAQHARDRFVQEEAARKMHVVVIPAADDRRPKERS